jgi:hypothetical protein
MNHHHVGPEDEACPGCIDEANETYRASQRLRTVAGVLILIVLVIAGMIGLSMWLSTHGSHLR